MLFSDHKNFNRYWTTYNNLLAPPQKFQDFASLDFYVSTTVLHHRFHLIIITSGVDRTHSSFSKTEISKDMRGSGRVDETFPLGPRLSMVRVRWTFEHFHI